MPACKKQRDRANITNDFQAYDAKATLSYLMSARALEMKSDLSGLFGGSFCSSPRTPECHWEPVATAEPTTSELRASRSLLTSYIFAFLIVVNTETRRPGASWEGLATVAAGSRDRDGFQLSPLLGGFSFTPFPGDISTDQLTKAGYESLAILVERRTTLKGRSARRDPPEGSIRAGLLPLLDPVPSAPRLQGWVPRESPTNILGTKLCLRGRSLENPNPSTRAPSFVSSLFTLQDFP
ncbi:hypothetical protein PAL_GLEAN10010640 [Pteropus alecto]|uniref:Uncharacterized protein n=1 Tax=Pteropus alecto TaxID=9402 RepID=L5KCK7_PTEAL|nr:hypothetical protein PAL_GLEAN10010640 [Pteropus alecto]